MAHQLSKGQKRRYAISTMTAAAFIMTAAPFIALGEPIIYPEKGQSQEQLEKDKAECYAWAKQQSGFDPNAPVAAPPEEAKKGGAGKGAARGAAVGAAVGAIAGDAGKGAAAGAAGGGLLGGMRRQDQKAQQKQAEEQQAAAVAESRSVYDRAFAACMEGRDYSLK